MSVIAGATVKYDTISLGKYKAEQLEEADLLPPPTPGDDDDRSDIDFSYGPVKIRGYVTKATFGIGVVILVGGISAGNFYGNVSEGLAVDINFFSFNGSVKLQTKKDDSEVWTRIDMDVDFGDSFNQDVKVLSF